MRIVLFTDANGATSTALVRATLHLIDRRDDLELCGFVTTRPDAFRTTRPAEARRLARRVVVATLDPRTAARLTRRHRIDLYRLAHGRGVPVMAPPAGDVNDEGFVARLADGLRPDVAMSYYCGRIWKEPLLETFAQAVNYHDGLLPAYRGVGATSFSIYRGERESGFTFHRMVPAIDAGPILEQGSVTIGARSFAEVDEAKVAAAVAVLPAVFDRIVHGDPGRPQVGPSSYFSARDRSGVSTVADPQQTTTEELQRRIRAFGAVAVTIGGSVWPVTRVRPGRHGRLAFVTADGSWCTAERVVGLPARLARPIRS